MGKVIGGSILAVIGIIVVFALLFGFQIAGIRLGGILNQEQQNANRKANQQSQQYDLGEGAFNWPIYLAALDK